MLFSRLTSTTSPTASSSLGVLAICRMSPGQMVGSMLVPSALIRIVLPERKSAAASSSFCSSSVLLDISLNVCTIVGSVQQRTAGWDCDCLFPVAFECPSSHRQITQLCDSLKRTLLVTLNRDYPPNLPITKVTFTRAQPHARMQSWFGSSGGGLPGVLSCEVQGAFYFPGSWRLAPATFLTAVHPIKVLEFTRIYTVLPGTPAGGAHKEAY